MKASLWVGVVVLAVVLSSTSWGRLGETPEQFEERYGPTMNSGINPSGFVSGVTIAVYQKAGFSVCAVFYKGSAGLIIFQKNRGRDAIGNAPELSLPEIQALLKANGVGKEWEIAPPSSRGPLGNAWQLKDQSAVAEYIEGQARLVIQTTEYRDAERARLRAEEEKNLKILEGF